MTKNYDEKSEFLTHEIFFLQELKRFYSYGFYSNA